MVHVSIEYGYYISPGHEPLGEIIFIAADGSMWTEKRRMTRYRVVYNQRTVETSYVVERKKWYNLFWHRCTGREYDLFSTVELAKRAIPDYHRGAYWVGTMVDLTKERLGINNG